MKQEMPLQYAAIGIDEEKMWKSPTARMGERFHYDLETDFALSETQMKAIISIVTEFRKERPCYERMKFETRRMVEE